MKKWILAFCLLLQIQASQALDASISYSNFKSSDNQYIEIFFNIVGETVGFLPLDSGYNQANIEIVILFKQGEEIVKFDKFKLNSPKVYRPRNFIDIKRYALESGEYDLEVSLKDLNKIDNEKSFKTTFEIDFSEKMLYQSDLQLLNSYKKVEGDTAENPFVKNGVYIEPLAFNFYDKNAEYLFFYNEIYNADVAIASDFMVSYFIEKEANNRKETLLIGHKKRQAKATNYILLKMDITTLPSGNYNFIVEVRDRENKLYSTKKVNFQRSNPYFKPDNVELARLDLSKEFVGKFSYEDLDYSIKALVPKVDFSQVEIINNLVKKKDEKGMRHFIFNYWITQNPNNPKIAFDKYMQVVNALDQLYSSGFGYGFETDRGYFYLKYGAPNNVVAVEDDPSAPPYEMWSYNRLESTKQSNVKFVFWNPSLVHNDYQLLHSSARGEYNNPRWKVELYNNAPGEQIGNPIDGTNMQDNFNRNAGRNFDDF